MPKVTVHYLSLPHQPESKAEFASLAAAQVAPLPKGCAIAVIQDFETARALVYRNGEWRVIPFPCSASIPPQRD